MRPAERGQALPMVLVAGVFLTGFILMAFSLGRALLERERVRGRVDATAISAAVDYARCLNILTVTEKSQSFAWLGDAALLIESGGGYLANIITGKSLAGAVAKIQDALLDVGPWVLEAGAVNLARENGLVAAPLWNLENGEATIDGRRALPDFNITRREPVKGFQDSSGSDAPLPRPNEESAYNRNQRNPRRRVGVEARDVEEVRFKRNGRWVTAYRQKRDKKFVAKSAVKKSGVPTDLVDAGEHSLIFIAWSESKGSESSLLYPVPAMFGAAKVRIAGGDMDMFSFNSSEYGPYFVPVFAGTAGAKIPSLRIPATHIAWVDEAAARINDALDLAASGEILH